MFNGIMLNLNKNNNHNGFVILPIFGHEEYRILYFNDVLI
ncbi:MAG: Uncharacterised protein [Flavobacteriaceae bacterium]|nr:MAG: Uncharacterised protein [Flavobacteriaceae bacterium]